MRSQTSDVILQYASPCKTVSFSRSEDGAKAMVPQAFYGDVVAHLASTLQDVVGLSDAEGFVATVGTRMGRDISDAYQPKEQASHHHIAKILVDLKRRIGGTFKVDSITPDQIILSNGRCPFGDRVKGRPALCMMTTNVFGTVVSDRNGYAHVDVTDSIAENGSFCRVVVTLNAADIDVATGTEFFAD